MFCSRPFNRKFYRYKLLSEILCKLVTEEIELLTALKGINILHPIYMAIKAYKEMSQSSFVKTRKILVKNWKE